VINKNQIIELIDGSIYLVLDKINYNNNNYLYIAKLNAEEKPTGEFDIVKETIKEEVPIIDYIEDEDLYENLKLSFLKRSEVNSNI
jgi:hypothetical protein